MSPVLPSVRPADKVRFVRIGVVVVEGHVQGLGMLHLGRFPVGDGVPDPAEGPGDAVVVELVLQVATNVPDGG